MLFVPRPPPCENCNQKGRHSLSSSLPASPSTANLHSNTKPSTIAHNPSARPHAAILHARQADTGASPSMIGTLKRPPIAVAVGSASQRQPQVSTMASSSRVRVRNITNVLAQPGPAQSRRTTAITTASIISGRTQNNKLSRQPTANNAKVFSSPFSASLSPPTQPAPILTASSASLATSVTTLMPLSRPLPPTPADMAAALLRSKMYPKGCPPAMRGLKETEAVVSIHSEWLKQCVLGEYTTVTELSSKPMSTSAPIHVGIVVPQRYHELGIHLVTYLQSLLTQAHIRLHLFTLIRGDVAVKEQLSTTAASEEFPIASFYAVLQAANRAKCSALVLSLIDVIGSAEVISLLKNHFDCLAPSVVQSLIATPPTIFVAARNTTPLLMIPNIKVWPTSRVHWKNPLTLAIYLNQCLHHPSSANGNGSQNDQAIVVPLQQHSTPQLGGDIAPLLSLTTLLPPIDELSDSTKTAIEVASTTPFLEEWPRIED